MAKSILVVDDSESIRELVGQTLSDKGFEVQVANDGIDGLDKAKESTYNLIVTDLNMPNMDGMEYIRELRALEQYKMIPILVLTTESQVEKKKEAKEAGATGWIVKPFVPEKLLAIIAKVLR